MGCSPGPIRYDAHRNGHARCLHAPANAVCSAGDWRQSGKRPRLSAEPSVSILSRSSMTRVVFLVHKFRLSRSSSPRRVRAQVIRAALLPCRAKQTISRAVRLIEPANRLTTASSLSCRQLSLSSNRNCSSSTTRTARPRATSLCPSTRELAQLTLRPASKTSATVSAR